MTATSPVELAERRRRVLEALPADGAAVVRGGTPDATGRRFRQTNEFMYLTGIEAPGAYALLDGRSGETTVYLPRRDERRERVEGPVLAAEDADEVRALSGAETVSARERLPADVGVLLFRGRRALHVPRAPAEPAAVTRDSALAAAAWLAADPFGPVEAPWTESLLRRFPQLVLHDLSPVLDGLRLLKSSHELELLRAAARLCGDAVIEAMRVTAPGVSERELEAVADLVFARGGARGGAYGAIVAGGDNAWYGHYSANDAPLLDGDLVLMDYAPDLAHYTSDIGRMWPVGGRFEPWQRELLGFVLDYHRELLARIRPGATPHEILEGAAAAMRPRAELAEPDFRCAAQAALVFAGHLSHPVGMAVHDVGHYWGAPLEPGLVFALDPMLWVPERRLYIRVEDTVAVTDDGVENLTGFVPSGFDEVERAMEEPGLVQRAM